MDRTTPQGGTQLSVGVTRRRVLLLALPAVGEQLLNTLVGLVDVYLVGNLSEAAVAQLGYSSASALTAVGLGNQFGWLMMVLFMAVGVGTTALVSRAIGARDHADLERIMRQTMLLALLVGFAATLIGFFLADFYMGVVGVPAEARALGAAYIQITATAFWPAVILLTATAAWRGAGDTRTPLLIMLGVNAVNMLVTWLFVNGQFGLPALGVQGAAIGTALARGIGGVVALGLLLRGHSGLKLTFSREPDPTTLRRLLRVGLPTAGEQLVFQGALLLFVRFITTQGTTSYAAHNITLTIESISFLPGLGYAAAVGALVGQSLGARQPAQAERFAYEGLRQGGLLMSLLGLLMALFPAPLVALFVRDPDVIAAAVPILRAAGLVQPALAVSFILLGALRGAGDTRWPLYSRIFTTWVMRLPLTFLLVSWLGLGLPGVWLAMCTDFTLQALLVLWRFSSRRWQRIEV